MYFEEVYHATAILEEKDTTPFAYSTGIFEHFNIPELFISGLVPNLSSQLIKNYSEKYQFGNVPIKVKIEDLIETFPVYFIDVEVKDLSVYVLTSIKFYEQRPYAYLQLIFPDLNGNFPNETNYKYDQKVIGNFSISLKQSHIINILQFTIIVTSKKRSAPSFGALLFNGIDSSINMHPTKP